jgi:hypothetical protein
MFMKYRKNQTMVARRAPARTFDHIQPIVMTEALENAIVAFSLCAEEKNERYISSNGRGLISI